MAAADFKPERLDQKYHFFLRKLHSLTGIVPIGVFLFEHMLTNSLAFYGGREKFNESVHWLHQLPYLLALEVFGIFLPIAFHAIYGIKIALTGESNASAYPYFGAWRYLFQRLTGYVAFLFVIVHLLKYRFADLVGWGPAFVGSADPFEITRNGLMAWQPGGQFVVPPVVTLTLYCIGLAAACFHFANGIWSFCISWGIVIGKKGQQRIGVVAALVGLLLFTWGSLSLYAFARAPEPENSPRTKVLADAPDDQAEAARTPPSAEARK